MNTRLTDSSISFKEESKFQLQYRGQMLKEEESPGFHDTHICWALKTSWHLVLTS